TPWWYFPLLAVTSAGVIASFDLESPWVTILAGLVAGAVFGAAMKVIEHRAGFSPRLAALPTPLKRRVYGYMIGHVVLVVAILAFAAFGTDGDWRFTVAGVASGLVLMIGATTFQSRYRAHARDLARQAGIDLG
ncbi:MAG TPA: hypothetical protein VK969_11290, partial [Acidimicrobiia bacterium]|nr:hypothetical protein [Acidimicrobiia bacterium]